VTICQQSIAEGGNLSDDLSDFCYRMRRGPILCEQRLHDRALLMSRLSYLADWPKIGAVKKIPQEDISVLRILRQMTLEEKIAQMIQPEMQQLTPEEAGLYKFGSALNGAGVWPGRNKYTTAAEWARTVDAYWTAVEDAYCRRPFRIPFMWAVDAVHGNNNLFGATIFPHNIGLGAANDPELIERIGYATAKEIAASGMDWTFAPTVAVPRDLRWGRHCEGYSEDPEIVHAYAGRMVCGLQGDLQKRPPESRIVACVKHWVGDGATCCGVDRGVARCSEEELINIHAMGYFAALNAGATVVMASFSSWENPKNYDHTPEDGIRYNYKLHGSRYLLTDILKNKLGFDGVVITDWDGHAEISKCTLGDARYAFNAGVDVLMVEARRDWQSVYFTTIADVKAGRISAERIDDAVTRILRMKFRAGLWEKPRPLERGLVHNCWTVGCDEHRALARESVRKSLVLLKNRDGILPLSRNQKVLVTGSAADNLQKQMGGWSLSWQGTDTTLADFPHSITLAAAIVSVVGADNCCIDPQLEAVDPHDFAIAIVAIGEDSYAEMKGDIRPWRTLEYAALKPSYARDRDIIRELRLTGIKIVTIFFAGRPLYLNEEINLSDAFVAAWLPGSEGQGITDVLFRSQNDTIAYDFQGKLSFRWPANRRSFKCASVPMNIKRRVDERDLGDKSAPLFPYGYGLTYQNGYLPAMHINENVPLDIDHDLPSVTAATEALELLGPRSGTAYALRIAGNGCWVGMAVSRTEPMDVLLGRIEPVDYLGVKDAVAVYFNGRIASIHLQTCDQQTQDLRGYLAAGALLTFKVKILTPPQGPVLLACHDSYPSQGATDITNLLISAPIGEWTEIRVPLSELEQSGSEFHHINTPFMLYTESMVALQLGNIRWTVCASY
jgi:beta-glucosidase